MVISVLRLIAVCAAGVTLASCATFIPFQARDEVIVRVGDDDKPVSYPVKPVASEYEPYALLATAAYEPSPGHILKWHTSWRRMDGLPKVKCPPGRLCAGEVGQQLWIQHNGNKCVEAVVVFRGSRPTSFDDWIANLHWFHQDTPIYDYYDQARDNIGEVVKIAEGERCAGHIIAVGHSLGGALAQHVAYKNPEIHRVYAFDPSFVVGTDDFFRLRIRMHKKDRYFDYVYEHGEILAFLRFISRHIQPYTECNPRIRTVRFNVLTGSITNQHSIYNLAIKLHELSQPSPHEKFDLHAGCPVGNLGRCPPS